MTRLFKELFILGLAFVALIYLMLPTFGIIELAPDFLPFVGWLDEGVATMILLNTARYYGLDLTALYGRNDSRKRRSQEDENPDIIYTERE